MATPATTDIVGEIVRLAVAEIRLGDRLRPVDPVWAEALGRVMLAEGQKTPIEVCRLPGRTDYLLVAGGHRLTGASLVGIEHLEARVVSNDALERRQREISENIWRKGLDPIDRAAFVAELIELRKVAAGIDPARDGRVVSAQARWSDILNADASDATDMMSVAYGWSKEVGEQLGFTERTIRRDLELHRGLRPDVAAQIRDTPIASNATQLRALAKLEEAEQRAIAAMIKTGDAKSVSEAQAMRDQRPNKADRDPQDVHFERLAALWSRMGAKTKRRVFTEILARDGNLPADLKALLAPLKEARTDA